MVMVVALVDVTVTRVVVGVVDKATRYSFIVLAVFVICALPFSLLDVHPLDQALLSLFESRGEVLVLLLLLLLGDAWGVGRID